MDFLDSVKKQFAYYRHLGTQTIERLNDEQLVWQPDDENNSIGIIVKHLWGNMMSRWTDFLSSDGEKEWRKRDEEFENDGLTKKSITHMWNEGWDCLEKALAEITNDDLERIIYIRNQGHTVMEAVNRQLSHYPYHVGQMVFLGKMILGKEWTSLSIPKGNSKVYNVDKFSKEQRRGHFTDEILKKPGEKNV
jgi:hypothetical protein